jgi:ABC-type amino acid transport substrate-binding protein
VKPILQPVREARKWANSHGLDVIRTAAMAEPRDPCIADIASSGVLRLALFPSFFYRKEATTGEPRGVGIEIARTLAAKIGVALKPAEYASPPKVVEALANGEADVALLGIDPVRGRDVDFSPPLLAADFTYLVREKFEAQAIPEADRPGIRVALVRHHAMDTALRGKLTAAQPVYAGTPDAAFQMFQAGDAEVLAGIRPGLMMYAGMMAGSRVLGDHYGRNVIALAVKKDAAKLYAFVNEFVTQAKADGIVMRAIESAGLSGVDVPP